MEKGGAAFVRQGATVPAIYSRIFEGRRYSATVQTGKKTLDPVYCKRVLRQLNRFGIKTALTFDNHFVKADFKRLP